uniref:Uncharacterized protein n=1 Tax=Arundo donax TaxID=35708 RepID=A0A0A9FWS2_ARUDO
MHTMTSSICNLLLKVHILTLSSHKTSIKFYFPCAFCYYDISTMKFFHTQKLENAPK